LGHIDPNNAGDLFVSHYVFLREILHGPDLKDMEEGRSKNAHCQDRQTLMVLGELSGHRMFRWHRHIVIMKNFITYDIENEVWGIIVTVGVRVR